jgi:hypothetical protein
MARYSIYIAYHPDESDDDYSEVFATWDVNTHDEAWQCCVPSLSLLESRIIEHEESRQDQGAREILRVLCEACGHGTGNDTGD